MVFSFTGIRLCPEQDRRKYGPAPRSHMMTPIPNESAPAAAPQGMQAAPRGSLGLRKPVAATRVVVAMSGGVDSSVVAAMLRREGYDVVGVTLQLYDHGAAVQKKGACCAGQDIHDARQVAARLGIPHYVLDYETRFRDRVMESFARSYVEGETPIPCVACNQHIKFADLFDTARELGADALATGHYIMSRELPDGGRGLFRAADADRDQSYFLFATTGAQLDLLRFPLGDLPKSRVRELAREFGLAVSEKADSQDICFVPSGKYTDVIERLRPGAAEPGDIVHTDGRVLGRHRGIIHYTIGQRRGLGLTDNAATQGEPLYVVKLDAASARVIVGPREALETRSIRLREINWIGGGDFASIPTGGMDVAVRTRSTRPPAHARLIREDAGARVELSAAEAGVSPGQACVFYSGTEAGARVLGGGIITAEALTRTADISMERP